MARTVADAFNQYHQQYVKPQMNKRAQTNSPAFTGTPTAPTADNDTDSTQIATTEFCQNLIRRLVGSAPETLNTLVELATAINNDPNFAQTIVQALDGKLNKSDAQTTYLSKSDASSTYLTQTSAANTYMKKSDGVDTSNLAKLNASNTFTQSQNIVGFKIYDNSGSAILESADNRGLVIRSATSEFALNVNNNTGTLYFNGMSGDAYFSWNKSTKRLDFNAPGGFYVNGTKVGG